MLCISNSLARQHLQRRKPRLQCTFCLGMHVICISLHYCCPALSHLKVANSLRFLVLLDENIFFCMYDYLVSDTSWMYSSFWLSGCRTSICRSVSDCKMHVWNVGCVVCFQLLYFLQLSTSLVWIPWFSWCNVFWIICVQSEASYSFFHIAFFSFFNWLLLVRHFVSTPKKNKCKFLMLLFWNATDLLLQQPRVAGFVIGLTVCVRTLL